MFWASARLGYFENWGSDPILIYKRLGQLKTIGFVGSIVLEGVSNSVIRMILRVFGETKIVDVTQFVECLSRCPNHEASMLNRSDSEAPNAWISNSELGLIWY